MAELLISSNDDMLNPPAMGLRTKAGAIRAAYGAIESHLQKPTCLFNADLFSRRLAPLSEAMDFLSTVDGRNKDRPRDAHGINEALMGLHEIGQTMLGDVPLHIFLTQMKFLGLRMCRLASATESLFAVLGDPKTFRQGLGSVQVEKGTQA